MHVLATAGHVDHGKSTLVRALTEMEPDRWAQERARGLTIDLGYVWTALAGAGDVAFVDVVRPVTTMVGESMSAPRAIGACSSSAAMLAAHTSAAVESRAQ